MGMLEDRLQLMISHQLRRYLGNIKGIFIIMEASGTQENDFVEMREALRESIEALEGAVKEMEHELRANHSGH